MLDELRATLDRHAELVTARSDPYERVLLRRRRRQRQRVAAIALVAGLLMAGPAAWLAAQDTHPIADRPSLEALRPLLDSPTRGSLAGDATFLAVLRGRASTEVDRQRGNRADGPHMPDDPSQIKVLFAGDVGNNRIVVLAGDDSWPLYAIYRGGPFHVATGLTLAGSGQLEPVLDSVFSTAPDHASESLMLLGPAGAAYEKGVATYTAAGVTLNWTRIETEGDYLTLDNLWGRHRFRVVLDGKVLLETEAGSPKPVAGQDPYFEARPEGGRGRPLPDAAKRAVDALSTMSGLSGSEASFRVLWSDEIDRAGTTTGRAYVVTVQAILSGGGGPYFTAAFDTGDGSYRDHPTGYGVGGDVEHTLIVMRLPHYVADPGDRLQIIAPPRAVRAEVTIGTQTRRVTLISSVGHLDVPPGLPVTVRAFDGMGRLMAEQRYVDLNGFGCDRFDPWSCPSPPPTLAPPG